MITTITTAALIADSLLITSNKHTLLHAFILFAQSDRDDYETQLRQTEVMCAAYSEELEQVKIRLSQAAAQDDSIAREVCTDQTARSLSPNNILTQQYSDLILILHFISTQNAQLKQELLRMAHNQYALQEQLAQANATNVSATPAADAVLHTASISGASSQSLYEDDDITALLQRYLRTCWAFSILYCCPCDLHFSHFACSLSQLG